MSDSNDTIITDMYNRISPLLQMGKTGDVTEEKKNRIFDAICRQDGHDPKDFEAKDIYRSNFVAGMTRAFGQTSASFMKDNADVTTTTGKFEMGRCVMEIAIDRHKRVPNRVLEKESGNFVQQGEKDLYGDATIKFKTYGAKNSKGDLKAERDALQGLFFNEFGKK